MLKNGIICILIILTMLSCGDNQTARSDKKMSLEDVNWIVGKWQDNVNSKQWEIWEKKENGYYGRGMFIKDRDTSLFEEMSISLEKDKLIFIALVEKNSEPIKFVSTSVNSNNVVFENPEHDFPQYISYTYKPNVHILQAEVNGGDRGFIVEMEGH